MENTIAAISTAMSNGGIGIVRLSGKDSFTIINKIFLHKGKEVQIKNMKGYTIKYGQIINPETKEIMDEVLVSFFKGPKSYTTEDMCEINCHGGVVVENQILDICLKYGALLAQPGEFTKRAFLNGRIDLSQAESIIDLINAKTNKEAKASIKQLEGELSDRIYDIKSDLVDVMADIEATIDYPEYDIPEITNNKIRDVIKRNIDKLEQLEKSFENGKLLKEGIKTIILGKPNAGKSSLLNTILKEERAIVSDIAGTTRDTIEEFVTIKGILLKIIDTAGIRETQDIVEKLGVDKSRKLAQDSDLIIAIFDLSSNVEQEDYDILDMIKDKKVIVLLNKTDICDNNDVLEEELKKLRKPVIKISATKRMGIDQIYDQIYTMFNLGEFSQDDSLIITNQRHKSKIELAKNHLLEVISVLDNNMPIDIISIYIKSTLEELGEIVGDNISEDIINKIFSKFCLGK